MRGRLFQALAEHASDMMYRYRLLPEPGFEYVNPACHHVTGYTPEEHYADPFLGLKIIHPEDKPILESYLADPCVSEKKLVLRWIRKDGSQIWAEQHNIPILDERGLVIEIEGLARDITYRKRLEEQLEGVNRSKELLFRELQHRIKNSFMMINGLFMLEMEKHEGTPPHAVLDVMQKRVNAISFLYTMLQSGESATRVSLNTYIRKLVEALLEGTTFEHRSLNIDLKLESMEVHSRLVVPIGLILNEAVTNCLKHAFPDNRSGTITISLRRQDPDHIRLEVVDDGVGLPGGHTPEQSSGMGTQLITMLCDQMAAKPIWSSGRGLALTVIIPVQ